MIVRAILENPKIAENFDYFNDYRDTRFWLLSGLSKWRETETETDAMKWHRAIKALDLGYSKYEEDRVTNTKKSLILKKIISGGQTGADIAGLEAAKMLNLKTGGWMPKGYLTQEGPKPVYRTHYNMVETASPNYPPRTAANVGGSDGTVRFAKHWQSPGEKLTLKCITRYKKPYFDIGPHNGYGIFTPEFFRKWLIDNKIEILNVAGNSEKTCPGIRNFTYHFLIEALTGYV